VQRYFSATNDVQVAAQQIQSFIYAAVTVKSHCLHCKHHRNHSAVLSSLYRTYLQFSSKLIYRSQVHCYHVVQLVAKLEGRNCVLTQRKAHQKLDVSTEVPTVSYLKGRIADTSYILCDKELRLAYLANRSRDRARIGEIVNKMTSFTR